ncbi:chemotaxis protein [Thioclava dalianensis]|uniref:Chemotaxis protein methyltransferase n=1 Tax=Thioclava dalianensis TaxID=1185766 RepID=A0A074TE42_9RHOB|nr:protein-glutamate O-methyltransferase [Thioclava dalianensis]KEP70041.1 chemotaxis protein [Thioclava dalianensis]SFN52840.1 chemotaxis protein methyltransferase CheR [Thioclava dalianensis]
MTARPASAPAIDPAALSAAELGAITQILQDAAGIVIAPGKASMVQSRLAKRLRALHLPDYASYISLVRSPEGQAERREMISALTTNVTHFFREKHHFDTLRTEVLPPLIERARAGGRVRIWSAGSSNGQEVYTIAMVLAELVPDFDTLDIRLLASDIDPRMIERGRAGCYPEAVVEPIPEALKKKYFVAKNGSYEISAGLRKLVSFRELNLHDPWPMRGRFDVIFCRNVVIYFAPEAQALLWQRFEAQLAPGGWMFVGHSERIATGNNSQLLSAGVTTYRLPDPSPKTGDPTWP